MAKKDKKNRKEKEESKTLASFVNLNESTQRAIGAVGLFVVTAFLIFAAFGKAGLVGSTTFNFLEKLLGVGYYLLPAVLLTLGVLFTLPRDPEKSVAWAQVISSFILFLAGLGLINIGLPQKGGLIGGFISTPLVKLFDTAVATIVLIGIACVSILAMFDTALKLHLLASPILRIFGLGKKDEKVETPMKITGGDDLEGARPIEGKKEKAYNTEAVIAASEENLTVMSGMGGKNKSTGPVFKLMSQKPYTPPPLDLLETDKGKAGVGDIKANANIIKRTLQNFGIDVEMDEISIGPSVTRYALKPAEGVKLARIVALQNDLALALAAHPIRIEAPIPGKSLVGIEIPNNVKTTVGLGTLVGNTEFSASDKSLLVALGKGVSGRSHYSNLAKMPHLLVAGATGSGKSVTIHALITSLLYRNSPEHLKFIMVDPKRVELTLYNSIPHLLTPVITEPKKSILALKWAAKEMDRRYEILQAEKVRDIDSYHKNVLAPKLEKFMKKGGSSGASGSGEGNDSENAPETMPYIVIIIDELADIMQSFPRELEAAIVRLAQMSRAVGIHLILSTQRPSVNVITGLIKANIPTRIALQVTSQIDSRTILDAAGAEKLLGAGDMLFQSSDMSQPQRLQSAFITEREVKNVVDFLKNQYKDELIPSLDITGTDQQRGSDSDALFDSMDEADEDELYEEAREIVMQAGKASTSFLQRKLRIGYARAARLIDILEERGVVSGGSGAKPRDVLMSNAPGASGMPGSGPIDSAASPKSTDESLET